MLLYSCVLCWLDTALLLLRKADHPVMNEQLLLQSHEAGQKGLIPLHKSITQARQTLKATHTSDINPRMGIFEPLLYQSFLETVTLSSASGTLVVIWHAEGCHQLQVLRDAVHSCQWGLRVSATHRSRVFGEGCSLVDQWDDDQECIFLTKRVEFFFVCSKSDIIDAQFNLL